MSERPPHEIIAIVPGDWPWIYAAFLTLRTLIVPHPQHQLGRDLGSNGYRTTIYRSAGDPVGTIEITGTPGETDIVAAPANPLNPEDVAYWQEIVKRLQSFASIRRHVGPTADEMIEMFYRRKAQNPRATLKAFADENLWNYEALKKHKQRYDTAGKWGSKKGTRHPPKMDG
jgi:hypothetical protein